MRYVILISLLLLLQGCVVWDIIKPSSAGLSIDTDIETDVIEGDKTVGTEAEVAVDSKITGKKETTTTTNTAETITQTYTTVNETKTDYFGYLMAFLIGWLTLPSIRQMVLRLKKIFTRYRAS